MAQLLSAALAEDQDSVPRTHMVANNHLNSLLVVTGIAHITLTWKIEIINKKEIDVCIHTYIIHFCGNFLFRAQYFV